MKRGALLLAMALAVGACSGDDDATSGEGVAVTTTAPAADVQSADVSGESAEPQSAEPVGPADMNTIRIGGDVWARTLPMKTGQCFLYEDDGNLPTSAVAWGTLDNDDSWGYSVDYNQDGSFEAEVRNDTGVYWFAGERSPGVNDLVIELDFEALTITGSGTFTDALGNAAGGSFAIQCEPDEG